jgi:heme-degrading monooxygenase HmoA
MKGNDSMFTAMNRFRVKRGSEAAFERIWLEREVYIDRVPGFVGFHLLRGAAGEDHTLYSSWTLWTGREAFEAWTRSEAFERAHRDAAAGAGLAVGHPEFEGFEVIQEVLPARPAAA